MVDKSNDVLASTETVQFTRQARIRNKVGSDALLLRGKPINNSQSTYTIMMSEQEDRHDSKHSK